MRLPRGSLLVVASHNEGKVREIKALLGPHGILPVSAGSLGLPEPEETELTFEGYLAEDTYVLYHCKTGIHIQGRYESIRGASSHFYI